ncbi:MAG: IPT/TIG domain-containing protein [Bacteroidales bacterium]|nr:IPT/TIG domain-containing protein [Bacteroidales bacterium]
MKKQFNVAYRTKAKPFLPCLIFFLATMSCNNDDSGSRNPYDKPHNSSQPVAVNGIGPTTGGIGTKVVINGENFGNDVSKVSVWFNDKKALVMKVQDNAIYALVPKQPGDYSTVKVAVDGKESVLEDVQFRYFIRSTVTTVAGTWNKSENPPKDGSALESTFYRPAKVAVDDEGNVLVADDQSGARIRLISTKDNRMTTVLNMTVPWSCTFNEQFSHFYVMERNSGQRPLLFYSLSKESNYMIPDLFYDQIGDDGNRIFGSYTACAFAADDAYVYMMSERGERFVRVHQQTKKMELIGQSIPTGQYSHMVYNKVDGKLYLSLEASGRIMRFDPHHTPPGMSTPWITWDDMEWIIGTGVVSATSKEGNGHDAQLGTLCGLGADHDGNVYICDQKFHCVWKVDPLLNCTIFAGPPAGAAVSGYRDGKPEEAQFNRPYDITATYDGLIYVADTYNYVVRCISIQ